MFIVDIKIKIIKITVFQVVEQLAGADVEIPKHLYLVVESQSNNRKQVNFS